MHRLIRKEEKTMKRLIACVLSVSMMLSVAGFGITGKAETFDSYEYTVKEDGTIRIDKITVLVNFI